MEILYSLNRHFARDIAKIRNFFTKSAKFFSLRIVQRTAADTHKVGCEVRQIPRDRHTDQGRIESRVLRHDGDAGAELVIPRRELQRVDHGADIDLGEVFVLGFLFNKHLAFDVGIIKLQNIHRILFEHGIALFKFFGVSFFFGLGVMIAFMLISLVFHRKFKKFQKEQMRLKDIRMKIITETFNNIKIFIEYNF